MNIQVHYADDAGILVYFFLFDFYHCCCGFGRLCDYGFDNKMKRAISFHKREQSRWQCFMFMFVAEWRTI